MAFTSRIRLAILPLLALAATAAHAQIVVGEALGTLGPGTISRSGTTAGQANNVVTYSNNNLNASWDGEFVYSFTLAAPSTVSLSGLSDAAGADNDAFLLRSLTTYANAVNGRPTGQAIGNGEVYTSGTFGNFAAGTYYLSIDAYQETAGTPAPGSAYSFDLTIASFTAPPAPAAITSQVGGSSTLALAAGQVQFYSFDYTGGALSFDTEGSTLSDNDTELGLYDSLGNLVAIDDDGGTDFLSLLSFDDGELAPGTYYLAAGAYNTTFADGFVATTNSTSTGTLVINGLSPSAVPEPASMAALGLGALALLRRRSRRS